MSPSYARMMTGFRACKRAGKGLAFMVEFRGQVDVVHVVPGRTEQHPTHGSPRKTEPVSHAGGRREHPERVGELLLEQVGCLVPVPTPPSVEGKDLLVGSGRGDDRFGHPLRRARSRERISSPGTASPASAWRRLSAIAGQIAAFPT
jgi:hypothetical protein